MRRHDFREFVFTVTGKDTQFGSLGIIELFDNLVSEVERLEAVAELLADVKHEEFEPRILPGIALLVDDVRARMRAILDTALAAGVPKPAPEGAQAAAHKQRQRRPGKGRRSS